MDPTTYSYINSSYIIDAAAPKHYPGAYSTDTVRDMGLAYLERIAKSEAPFFIGSELWNIQSRFALLISAPPSRSYRTAFHWTCVAGMGYCKSL